MGKERGYEVGGVAFLGCCLVGFGWGLLYHLILPGLILGAGMGFILMAIIRAILDKK